MGYTHYWYQTKTISKKDWKDVVKNIELILKDCEHVQNIPLGNWKGTGNTRPEITNDCIKFNGIGQDSHETLIVERVKNKNNRSFCKTNQKPYDLAVTACLVYLEYVMESHKISSDGCGSDWLAGVEEARRAVPQYANIYDIPMIIMKNDVWTRPFIEPTQGFTVGFCVDGMGYVVRNATEESYCFESHKAFAQWLSSTQSPNDYEKPRAIAFGRTPDCEPNIWNAYGSFDEKRQKRLNKLRTKALCTLFPVDPACAKKPPAYVRPREMPAVAVKAFSFEDILKL